jgi:hypothetical protein
MPITPLTPFTVYLRLGGCRLEVASYTEAGLTLTREASLKVTTDELRRGRLTPASLVLCADDTAIRYSVMVRLASRSTGPVEVALAELPSEARLRLRHASAGQGPAPRESLTGAARPDVADAADSRRLALPGSASVNELTRKRRERFDGQHPPRDGASGAADQAVVVAGDVLGAGIVALAFTTAVLVVLALAYALNA